eukprot:m.200568 g.200568  ORF g.200568 m.200568 type:complete len:261 (+) comp21094_c0_seq1:104-886(+)
MAWSGNVTAVTERIVHDYPLRTIRVHLWTYKHAFIARELVLWLIKHGLSPDEPTAALIIDELVQHDLVVRVSGKSGLVEPNKDVFRFDLDMCERFLPKRLGSCLERPSSGHVSREPSSASLAGRVEGMSSTMSHGDVYYGETSATHWRNIDDSEITKAVLDEMANGYTSLVQLRPRLVPVLTEEGVTYWEPLIKPLIDKFGGQIQQLLRSLDKGAATLKLLSTTHERNERWLAEHRASALALAAQVDGALSAARENVTLS